MVRTLGIIGGMGPLATVDLFKRIVLSTEASCDQEHIHILIDNNTSIPDRTAYILGRGENPREYLVKSAKKLEAMGADFLIMPCNTAHYFYEDIKRNISIPFLSMIEETAKYIKHKYADETKVGLLATEGTCSAHVYDDVFSDYGIEIIKPADEMQIHITRLIYGIKAGKYDMNLDDYYSTLDEMKKRGVNIFILGCTELSAALNMFNLKGDYVDAVDVLVASAINFAGKNIKNSKALK